jgi:hypothetical protein
MSVPDAACLLARREIIEGLLHRLDMEGDDLLRSDAVLDKIAAEERCFIKRLFARVLEVCGEYLSVAIEWERELHDGPFPST